MSSKGKKVHVKENSVTEISGPITINLNLGGGTPQRERSQPPIGALVGVLGALGAIMDKLDTKGDISIDRIREWTITNIKDARKEKEVNEGPDQVAWGMRLDGLERFLEAVTRFKEDETAIDLYYETEEKFANKKAEGGETSSQEKKDEKTEEKGIE